MYVSRAEWGARKSRGITWLPANQVSDIVTHHSASAADIQHLHKHCFDRVRGIQNFHMDGRGWNDIAYNYLVCSHGAVFEGRGFGVMSAATLGANSHTYAVCVLGDDPRRIDITPACREGLVNAHRLIQKKAKKKFKYSGHRNWTSTECPGNELYSFIKSKSFAFRVNHHNPVRLWFPAWAKWRLTDGRKATRPKDAPEHIPAWAWAKLRNLRP